MLIIQLHTLFTTYIVTNAVTGKLSISPSIMSTLRSKLYMSLSKALDANIKEDIGWDNVDESDGVLILQKMKKTLGLKQDSTINSLKLVSVPKVKMSASPNIIGVSSRQ